MSIIEIIERESEPLYRGLRLTAEEYFELPDDGYRYELIDGVVCMSPSPMPKHQEIITHIAVEIGTFLRAHKLGKVYVEIDVVCGKTRRGGDLVYRPDVVYVQKERVPRGNKARIAAPVDLIVEVISPDSRRYDSATKKVDYERAGVEEYWLLDPELENATFLRLRDGRYQEIAATGDVFESEAIPGFCLDLEMLRELFKPL